MAKTIKVILDDALWERFYRAFPGHGERSILIRRIIRHIIMLKPMHKPFHAVVAEEVIKKEERNG